MTLKIMFASAAMLAGLLVALPAARAQAPKASITIGLDVDAGTLDPRKARDTSAYRIADLIYDGLVSLSPDLKPQPNLAERWENPEPTVWIFHLRDKVAFHDGKPLTAEDVVYTYRTIIDPAFNAPLRALFTPIKSIEATDPKIVKITLAQPYSPLLSYLDMGIVPKHIAEAGSTLDLNPVGSGPMRFSAWTRGSRITLAANENYWRGAPALKEMKLSVIGDNTARAQAFEAGDLDFIQSPLSPTDIRRLEKNDKFAKAITSGVGVTYLNFNTGDPVLADPKLRRALAMAVDQTTIVDKIYEGVDKVATSVLLPSSWSYSTTVKQPGFNLAGAKAALAELGWKESGGALMKDGKKLSITIATHSEDPNRVQTLEYMQTIFASIGVEAKPRISDWPSFSTGYVQQSQHQVALLGWLNLIDPDRLLYAQLHSDGSLNWGKYKNPDLDKLLDEGRTALDINARKAAYEKAAEIVARDLPYYIISYQGYQAFYSKALGGYAVNPRGNLRSLVLSASG